MDSGEEKKKEDSSAGIDPCEPAFLRGGGWFLRQNHTMLQVVHGHGRGKGREGEGSRPWPSKS